MPTLFLIVFINLLGFGLLIPLIPFYAVKLDLSYAAVTFVTMGVYSLAQFIMAPIVGRLSDHYGRKPILAITMFGTAISYVLLIYADTPEMLFFARAFAGINAGNLSTAYAYVADITSEEDRAKGLGLIGAAFGLGFVFGPVLGGFLAGDSYETANYVLPSAVSAALSTLAGLGVVIFLKESLSHEIRDKIKTQVLPPLQDRLKLAFGRQILAMLVITGFLFVTTWSQFEVIYPLWAEQVLAFGPRDVALTLGYVGVVSAIIQGGLIGPLTNRFGEHALLFTSLFLVMLGYVVLAGSSSLTMVMLSITLLTAGSALFNPSISSLVSKEADDTEQGAVLGIYQGAGSLARILGPSVSGIIFEAYGASAPYLAGAVLIIPALLMVWQIMRHRRTLTHA